MRWVRWVLLTLASVLVLLGALAFVWRHQIQVRWSNLDAMFLEESQYREGLENQEEILAYLGEHRRDISLVSYTVTAEGGIEESDPHLSHRADEPMPLASTVKIVVLAAYAREVAENRLDPDERVPVQDWERYYLPGTDGGAHQAALEELGLGTDEDGWAEDAGTEVALDQIAHAMIETSDNAATDYLMNRVGEDRVLSVIDEAGLREQEPPLSLVGTFLLWFDLESENPRPGENISSLKELSQQEYAAEVRRLEDAYAGTGPDEGNVRRWRQEGLPITVSDLRHQGQVADAFETRGTAQDYARIMAGVVTGTFVSPEVSEVMRRHLEWPMEMPGNQEELEAFGAKGGSLPGVLTEAWYQIPEEGDFGGNQRITVLFMRDMPLSAWFRMTDTFGQQEFMVALATDREFVGRVARELRTPEEAGSVK